VGRAGPILVFGQGRGKGAAGGVALNFCRAVESAVRGVGFLGDPELELEGRRPELLGRIGAFSEERREDVTRDFLSPCGRMHGAAAFEVPAKSDDSTGTLGPA
jgi:hypothetical protein